MAAVSRSISLIFCLISSLKLGGGGGSSGMSVPFQIASTFSNAVISRFLFIYAPTNWAAWASSARNASLLKCLSGQRFCPPLPAPPYARCPKTIWLPSESTSMAKLPQS